MKINFSQQNFISLCFLTFISLFYTLEVKALDPRKMVSQYVHNIWSSNDGLPQDSINSIVQTPDGYFWIATQEGFARFDGIRFTVFDSSNTQGVGSFVYTLFVDRKGTLWIGTGGGLLNYREGKFTRFTVADGLPDVSIKHISEDSDGNLWLGAGSGDRTAGGQGLTYFKDGRGTIFTTENGLSNNQVHRIFCGDQNDVWIATGNGLNYLKDGKFKNYTTADGLSSNLIRVVYKSRKGILWVGTSNGLNRFENGKFTTFTSPEGSIFNSVTSIFEDKDSNLWVGTDKGLRRFRDGKLESVAGIDGLSDDRIFSFFEDVEGSLWIGTHANGLHQLRDGKFTTFGSAEGLSGDSVQTVFQDSLQRIWLGTSDGGLSVLVNDRLKNYTIADGLLSDRVRTIYEDKEGSILIGTDHGLNKLKDGKFTSLTTANGLLSNNIRSIYEDETGALWIGTGQGLSLFKDNKFTNFTRADGLLGNGVNFVYQTKSGEIYVAGDDGLSIYRDGKFIPQREGFPVEFNPQSIAEDEDGTLWLTTWGQGLNRLKNGKLTAFVTKDGIYDNSAWSILDDGNGRFWLGSNRGVFRVLKKELNDFADGKIQTVSSIVYGTANGMRKRETNAGGPSAIRSKDGKLWFATTDGVVQINPNEIITNNIPPPIVIEKLIADEQSVTPDNQNYELIAGTKNIEFQYVGLSFVAPGRVKYKYKIEGFDKEWIEADNRRTAYYTNLPPGNYMFRVIAANNDGIWNEQGASLKFRILAPFWMTWWFIILIFLSLMGLVYFVSNWRVSRLEKANAQQTAFSRQLIEAQEKERKRIAAELHDNLGQRLIIIKNWAAIGLKISRKDAPEREQLEEISTTALQAIDEVREIIYDLRPLQIETAGLNNTIKFMIEQISASSGIKFSADCDEINHLFAPEDEVTIYRIIQECVSNIVKHSEAKSAVLTIRKIENNIKITISDDGKGFVPEMEFSSKKRGAFGLTGLNERVKMLGGILQIQSAMEKGTTISVEIESEKQV